MGSCLIAVFGIKTIETLGSRSCVLDMFKITDEKIKFLFRVRVLKFMLFILGG